MIGILLITLIICIVFLLWYRNKEGFQLNDPDVIQNNFWAIIKDKNDPLVMDEIARVRSPDPNDKKDKMPVTFPIHMSIYAMAKYNYDLSGARNALFQNYDMLQSEMTTNLYDQGSVSAWTAEPKKNTCAQLDTLMNTFTQELSNLRTKVQDLSGTAMLAGSMRDENMDYQIKYTSACNSSMSPACMNLASQEGPVFPLLAQYNSVNHSLFSNEYDISNNIQMLRDTYDIMQCTNPNPTAKFEVEKSTGYIDTSILLTKLQDLSPYYLSPDTLNYITSSIVSPNDAKNSVITTSDLYINIAKTINNIKALTNT
jgi:hypothetical protein